MKCVSAGSNSKPHEVGAAGLEVGEYPSMKPWAGVKCAGLKELTLVSLATVGYDDVSLRGH